MSTKTVEPIKRFELGGGLELWYVHVDQLLEQDVNARIMPKTMFDRLTRNISRWNRLESLPLCALTDRGLEIVSGHHRVRAARAADMMEIWVLVDVTGLTRDQIRAKQVAHNAIQGQDDPTILRAILEEIKDADALLEAYLDPKELDIPAPENVNIEGLDVGFEFESVSLLFLPRQLERFEMLADYLEQQKPDHVMIAAQEDYEKILEAIERVARYANVKARGTALAIMADMILDILPAAEDEKEDAVNAR